MHSINQFIKIIQRSGIYCMNTQCTSSLQAFLFFCVFMYACGTLSIAADTAITDNSTFSHEAISPSDELVSQPSYTVQHGDCLGKILREVFKLPDAIIFSPQTTLTMQKENPHIHNLNDLHTGEKLFVPAQILQHGQKKTMASDAGKQTAPSVADQAVTPPSLPEKKQSGAIQTPNGFAGTPPSDEQSAHTIQLATDETTIREASLTDKDVLLHEKKIRGMLLDFTKALGGHDNTSCIKNLSIENGGTIHMDCSQFPIYEFPWGGGIILDYGGKLSAHVQKIISAQWEQTDIITAGYHEDAETIFARVINGCGLHKIESFDRYTVSRDNIQISMSGNWIVYKDNSQKEIFVITITNDSRHQVPDSLSAYLTDMGINLVHLGPAEKKPAANTCLYTPIHEVSHLQADPVRMTDMILELVGITAQKNVKTKIIPQNARGIIFEVTIDRKFELTGKTCFIDFKNLSHNIVDMLTNNGYKILQIDLKSTNYLKSMHELLDFCAFQTSSSVAHFQYDQSEKASIKISIPGFLIHAKSGDILLTNSEIDKNILIFLSEMDIQTVRF